MFIFMIINKILDTFTYILRNPKKENMYFLSFIVLKKIIVPVLFKKIISIL